MASKEVMKERARIASHFNLFARQTARGRAMVEEATRPHQECVVIPAAESEPMAVTIQRFERMSSEQVILVTEISGVFRAHIFSSRIIPIPSDENNEPIAGIAIDGHPVEAITSETTGEYIARMERSPRKPAVYIGVDSTLINQINSISDVETFRAEDLVGA